MARLAALVCIVLAAGCGPTDEEAAAAVLISAPLVIALSQLFVVLLARLWRPVRVLPVSALPTLVAVAVAIVGAGFLAVTAERDVRELAIFAVWIFGTTFLALHLVSWRLWVLLHPETASTWSFLPVVSISLIPAVAIVRGVGGDFGEYAVAAWVFGGYGGIVTAPLFLILLAEVLVRRWLKKRRTGPAPR